MALGAAAPNKPVEVVVVAAPNSEGADVEAAAPKRGAVAAVEPKRDSPVAAVVVAGAAAAVVAPKVGKGVDATVAAGAVAGAPKEKGVCPNVVMIT